MNFTHLRLHTEHSMVDSIIRIDSVVARAEQDNQGALAISDLGNMFGWVKFYRAARAKGIKPLCGVDIYVTNDADRDRPSRLLLIACNAQGYRRLCELLSRAWLENQYRGRGEFRRDWFEHEQDLIALSGFMHGDVGAALIGGQIERAAQCAKDWQQRFGDNFFIELQRFGHPEAENCTRASVKLAAQLNIACVATHPSEFIDPDQFDAHEARVCIAEGEILTNPKRPRKFFQDQFFRSQEQMLEAFADLPQALANSVIIAQRCNLNLELGKAKLPLFPTPTGMTLDDYLIEQAGQGLDKKLPLLFERPELLAAKTPEYRARLQYECNTIIEMGFSGYFLIVADFINWAKQNGVPVGPGRGSGAGSLVAYVLGITDLDPLPYGLLFERFLNPERVSMPDFDIDFCQDKRYLVIEYVRQKYGAAAVSQIATFGTMASKAVIRDAGRVLDMPYSFCDQLSKLIPVVQNKPLSLEKAREAEPQLAQREQAEEEVRELLALAGPLEDLIRNVGMHAGGVLIAPGKLTDFCPLYQAAGGDSVISQYDKDDIEAVGLVKFDFLGLRNLTIIDLAVKYINQRHPQLHLDLAKLSLDDPKAYKILRDGNTTAVFQVEGDGMKKMLRKLGPDRFEDVIAALALYRPGPLGSGMVDDFILRKKGKQTIDYFHPDLKACLEPTYGVIVYQEQVMQISQIIGGYTLGGADLLRRAMGKKKAEEMAAHRQTFTDGAQSKGYPAQLATHLFDLMAMFAEYGFNKSHSAAYALLTYQTAWLKAKYPAEFMAATLSSDMDDTDKVQLFVQDARSNKVKVIAPDINLSQFRFEPISSDTVAYGLGAVKGTGEAAVLNILKARQEGGAFANLFDFCQRVDRKVVNRRCIEALIRAGAFDTLGLQTGADRATQLASLTRALATAEQNAANADQASLFGGDEVTSTVQPQWMAVPAWEPRQQLREEKAALGFYLSGHLFASYSSEVRRMVKQRLIDVQPSRDPIWLAGIASSMRTQNTRRGKMLAIGLEDDSGGLEVMVYSELYDSSRHLLREDELLFVQVKVQNDEYSGGMRATATRLASLAQMRAQFVRNLTIELNGNADVLRLRKVLEPFKSNQRDAESGSVPVLLRYHRDGVACEIKLPQDWQVRPDDALFASLRDWVGEQAMTVNYV
jgi:DNA polymerase III subunit alpha